MGRGTKKGGAREKTGARGVARRGRGTLGPLEGTGTGPLEGGRGARTGARTGARSEAGARTGKERDRKG